MPRTRKGKRVIAKIADSSTDEDEPLKKKSSPIVRKNPNEDNSSSESDLDMYLKSADQINLNSTFFDKPVPKAESTFEAIEKDILSGVDRLTDSESEHEDNLKMDVDLKATTTTLYDFADFNNYNKKIENAKKILYKCNAKKEDKVNVKDLLAVGEMKADVLSLSNLADIDTSDSEDWEEVESKHVQEKKDVHPKNVEIVVSMPSGVKKKKEVDLMMKLRRRLNRVKKENQVSIHKVSLLCWIAHGNYVNSVLNNESVMGLALSLLPSQQSYPDNRINLKYLEQIVTWYKKLIKINENLTTKDLGLEELLKLQIEKKEVLHAKYSVYIFVCILRSLGVHCRLVISLQPEPLQPPSNELFSLSSKESNSNKSKSPKEKTSENGSSPQPSTSKQADKSEEKTSTKPQAETKRKNKKSKSESEVKSVKQNKGKALSSLNSSQMDQSIGKPNLSKLTYTVKKTNVTVSKSLRKSSRKTAESGKTDTSKIAQLDGNNDSDSDAFTSRKPKLRNLKKTTRSSPVKTRSSLSKKQADYNETETDSDDDFQTQKPNLKKLRTNQVPKPNSSRQIDVRNDIMALVKKDMMEENYKAGSKLVKGKKKPLKSDDLDYVPITNKQRKSEKHALDKSKIKRRIPPKSELEKQNSAEIKEKNKKLGVDVWAEVFLEDEEKWICVDVTRAQIHCIKELHSRATQPVSYILAWNNKSDIKDVTKRYCPSWNTVTRKLRIDSLWWESTLKPFIGPKTRRDKDEDEDLERQQLDQPLPKSISEYKNHPLYVLKRHLLKFEAIYPPDAITLGFIRNEPVYSRDCVYTLHSRDIWLKQAKVVKPGEQPYKIVKARPKYDKLSNSMITDQLLDIFGIWQVGEYEPPTAENGIVPRNAYGNVDLFKKCMLPKGTVHLDLPSLNKVARKMNIDCASAVTGFEFHSGWSHPVIEGYVVCKEYEEVLIAAWQLEQEESEKREQEKLDKRVYGNWKRLIKGVLILEKIKNKYATDAPVAEKKPNKEKRTRKSK